MIFNLFCVFLIITDSSPLASALLSRVTHRLTQAYRPKTWSSYKGMFITFMAFCEFVGKSFVSIELSTVLMFIEFLTYNGLRHSSILNYISAIKSQLKWFEIPDTIFDHIKVRLMLKAVNVSIRQPPKFKGIFDISSLIQIIRAFQLLPHPLVFSTLYLFAFFGFLRISNLLPPSRLSFDLSKQLCRGDILVDSSYAIVLVKWSKTLQASNQGSFIILPRLQNSLLCPLTSFIEMHKAYPVSDNSPLFCIDQSPVTQVRARSHLKKILSIIGLDPQFHNFHTFRRSGATLAFNQNIDLQKIKDHGTWSSDSVYTYIVADPLNAKGVAETFKKMFAK